MYHSVSDNMWGISELFVSPSSMEEQLAYLNENGYTTLFFEDLWNIENIEKPVILTFDDGYTDNYEKLFPLLRKYNCKATIFCISGWMGDADGLYINYERAREMADSGLVSIQSHGFSHQKLGAVPEDVINNELSLSKLMLTRITGREPYVIGYPHGSYSARSVQLAAECYEFGVLMDGGLWNTSDDTHMIRRYYVSRYTDLNTFASYCGG